MQSRNMQPDKYDTSPYVRLSEDGSSVRKVTIFFRLKHPFENHNDFDIDVSLINECTKIFQVDVAGMFIIILLKISFKT